MAVVAFHVASVEEFVEGGGELVCVAGGVLPPAWRFLFASCARAIPLVAGHCDARGACCLVV